MLLYHVILEITDIILAVKLLVSLRNSLLQTSELSVNYNFDLHNSFLPEKSWKDKQKKQ